MTYEISIGERKSLVFPIMCHGHLRIDYDDEVAGQNYGLFGYDGSFTIQAIITPYDVNGFGYALAQDNPIGKMGVLDSKKTMPVSQSHPFTLKDKDGANTTITAAMTESGAYSAGIGHTMAIFHNTNVEFDLVNSSTININQPAEYKLKLRMKVDGSSGGGWDEIESDTVIKANNISSDSTRWKGTAITYGYDSGGSGAAYEKIATIEEENYSGSSDGVTGNTIVITGSTNTNVLFSDGIKLYTRNGQTFTHAATVATVAASQTFTVDTALYSGGPSQSLANDDVLYIEAYKEALYLVTPNHIAATYDTVSGNMSLYLNGSLVGSKKHVNAGGDFEFDASDSIIGSNKNVLTPNTFNADTPTFREQFMGELHEFAITKGIQKSFSNVDTLIPNYRQTLLYFRFEETDL